MESVSTAVIAVLEMMHLSYYTDLMMSKMITIIINDSAKSSA